MDKIRKKMMDFIIECFKRMQECHQCENHNVASTRLPIFSTFPFALQQQTHGFLE